MECKHVQVQAFNYFFIHFLVSISFYYMYLFRRDVLYEKGLCNKKEGLIAAVWERAMALLDITLGPAGWQVAPMSLGL